LYPNNIDGLYALYELSSQALNDKKISLSEVILIKNISIVEHPIYGMYNLTKQKVSYSNYYYSSENIYQALNFEFQTTNKFEEFLVTQTNNFLKNHYFKIEENKYIIPNFENKENFDASSYLNELIKKQIKIKFTKET